MRGAVVLQLPPTRWVCPQCPTIDVTPGNVPNRYHACAGLAGLTAPLVPEGVRAEHRVRQREDYVGGEVVTRDSDGRPVMAVQTIRDEGEDCTVFAPLATAVEG